MELAFPDFRDFGELFSEAQPFVPNATPPAGWSIEWVFEDWHFSDEPVEDWRDLGGAKLASSKIGAFCSVANGKSLWVKPTAEVVNFIKTSMRPAGEDDQIHFKIVIKANGTSLVLAMNSAVLSSRWLAIIDTDSIPHQTSSSYRKNISVPAPKRFSNQMEQWTLDQIFTKGYYGGKYNAEIVRLLACVDFKPALAILHLREKKDQITFRKQFFKVLDLDKLDESAAGLSAHVVNEALWYTLNLARAELEKKISDPDQWDAILRTLDLMESAGATTLILLQLNQQKLVSSHRVKEDAIQLARYLGAAERVIAKISRSISRHRSKKKRRTGKNIRRSKHETLKILRGLRLVLDSLIRLMDRSIGETCPGCGKEHGSEIPLHEFKKQLLMDSFVLARGMHLRNKLNKFLQEFILKYIKSPTMSQTRSATAIRHVVKKVEEEHRSLPWDQGGLNFESN